jgi:hypothetical protein
VASYWQSVLGGNRVPRHRSIVDTKEALIIVGLPSTKKPTFSYNFYSNGKYHHLVYAKGLDVPVRIEENNANSYAKEFLKRQY